MTDDIRHSDSEPPIRSYVIGLLAGALVLAACGRSVEPAAVAISEGQITVEPETIRAGSLRYCPPWCPTLFEITNVGTEPHRYTMVVGPHEPEALPLYDWQNAQQDFGMGPVEWCVFMEFDYGPGDPPPSGELSAIEARRVLCEEAVARNQRMVDGQQGLGWLGNTAGEWIAPGETVEISGLGAGTYIIFCNLPGHYEQGEVAAVVVLEGDG